MPPRTGSAPPKLPAGVQGPTCKPQGVIKLYGNWVYVRMACVTSLVELQSESGLRGASTFRSRPGRHRDREHNVALSMLSAPEFIAGHRAHPRVGAAKGVSSSHSGVSPQGALEPMAQQVERIKVSYTR